MKLKQVFSAAVAMGALALLASGCSSFETNRQSGNLDIEMKTEAIPNIVAQDAKVEGSAKVSCLFGIFTWGCEKQAVGVTYGGNGQDASFLKFFVGANEVARNGAAYDACTKANADILLTPQYDLTIKDYFVFKTVDCQVKGFPATIKSVTIKK